MILRGLPWGHWGQCTFSAHLKLEDSALLAEGPASQGRLQDVEAHEAVTTTLSKTRGLLGPGQAQWNLPHLTQPRKGVGRWEVQPCPRQAGSEVQARDTQGLAVQPWPPSAGPPLSCRAHRRGLPPRSSWAGDSLQRLNLSAWLLEAVSLQRGQPLGIWKAVAPLRAWQDCQVRQSPSPSPTPAGCCVGSRPPLRQPPGDGTGAGNSYNESGEQKERGASLGAEWGAGAHTAHSAGQGSCQIPVLGGQRGTGLCQPGGGPGPSLLLNYW